MTALSDPMTNIAPSPSCGEARPAPLDTGSPCESDVVDVSGVALLSVAGLCEKKSHDM